jgi:hypothetical protein
MLFKMEQNPNENIEQKNEPQLHVVRPYTDADIEQYAGKVGGKRNLKEVVITTDDNYVFHYLVKKPSRSVLQAIAASESKKDTDAIQKLMIGCVLEGDKDSFEFDGAIYAQLLKQVGGLVNLAKGEFKNL